MKKIYTYFYLPICLILLSTTLSAGIDGLSSFQDFENAGKNGNIEAQFLLGQFYEKGQGVNRDIEKSLYWYRLAAEQGYIFAQEALGDRYARSNGHIPINYTESEKWYALAAKQGSALGQFALGFLNEKGMGRPKNSTLAAKWYIKAAEQGYPNAQFRLALLYETGNGVDRNLPQAVKLYQELAKKRNVHSAAAKEKLEVLIKLKAEPLISPNYSYFVSKEAVMNISTVSESDTKYKNKFKYKAQILKSIDPRAMPFGEGEIYSYFNWYPETQQFKGKSKLRREDPPFSCRHAYAWGVISWSNSYRPVKLTLGSKEINTYKSDASATPLDQQPAQKCLTANFNNTTCKMTKCTKWGHHVNESGSYILKAKEDALKLFDQLNR